MDANFDLSEKAFLYKTVNGAVDNSAFVQQLTFDITEGILHTEHFFPYHIPKTLMTKNSPLFRRCNSNNRVVVKYPKLYFSLSFVQYLKLLNFTFTSCNFVSVG
jgi:hypothetical protein